jgi:hypothetical protein
VPVLGLFERHERLVSLLLAHFFPGQIAFGLIARLYKPTLGSLLELLVRDSFLIVRDISTPL